MKCVYVWMDACVGEVYSSSSAVRFTGGREARRGGEWMQLTPYVVRCVRAWRRIVSFRPIVYSSCTGPPVRVQFVYWDPSIVNVPADHEGPIARSANDFPLRFRFPDNRKKRRHVDFERQGSHRVDLLSFGFIGGHCRAEEGREGIGA